MPLLTLKMKWARSQGIQTAFWNWKIQVNGFFHRAFGRDIALLIHNFSSLRLRSDFWHPKEEDINLLWFKPLNAYAIVFHFIKSLNKTAISISSFHNSFKKYWLPFYNLIFFLQFCFIPQNCLTTILPTNYHYIPLCFSCPCFDSPPYPSLLYASDLWSNLTFSWPLVWFLYILHIS